METDKPNGTICPLMSDKDNKVECIKRDCKFYIKVTGKAPQSEEQIDHWGCAIEWLPVLMIESSQLQRQTGAAVESFRNVFHSGINQTVTSIKQLTETAKKAQELEHDNSTDKD